MGLKDLFTRWTKGEDERAIEGEFTRQHGGAGAFDVDDIAIGEDEAESFDAGRWRESDEAHLS